MDTLNKINQASSSYKLSDDATLCLKDFKFMMLVMLQCGTQMQDYPRAAVSLILYRTLIFHNYSKHFTKLVDEYDAQSLALNSLVVTTQILQPPGNEMLFEFSQHDCPITHAAIGGDNDSFIFTLSNKLVAFNLSNLGELGTIELNKDDRDGLFSFFLVYLENYPASVETTSLKSILGGFLVATKNEIKAFTFNSVAQFNMKLEHELILDMALLSPCHVLIAYENEKKIDIFNFKTSILTKTITFECRVKKFASNTKNNLIADFSSSFGHKIHLMVLLEKNEIDFFLIDFDSKKDPDLGLLKLKTFPSFGFEVVSFSFLKSVHDKMQFKFTGFQISLSDGSLVWGESFDDDGEVKFFEIKSTTTNPNVAGRRLELVDYREFGILFINKQNGHVILIQEISFFQKQSNDFDQEKMATLEIAGNFQNAFFKSHDKIVCISFGSVQLFTLKRTNSNNDYGPIESIFLIK
jgi:hypothetical protein